MLGAIKKFFSRTDWVLLGLCLVASVFGIVAIASASNYHGASTYVSKQIIALVLGLILYVLISFIDMEIIAEHQTLVVIFSAIFLAMLYPLGVEGNTGNKSWLSIPGLPFMIQPAEYCKILYILVAAQIMNIYQERINSLPCVFRLALVSAVYVGTNCLGYGKGRPRQQVCAIGNHLGRYFRAGGFLCITTRRQAERGFVSFASQRTSRRMIWQNI